MTKQLTFFWINNQKMRTTGLNLSLCQYWIKCHFMSFVDSLKMSTIYSDFTAFTTIIFYSLMFGLARKMVPDIDG